MIKPQTSRKEFYDWERIFKGAANHRRLEMLHLLEKDPRLAVDEIITLLKINYQTGAEHLRRLREARLVHKFRKGKNTLHELTPRAITLLNYCKSHNVNDILPT